MLCVHSILILPYSAKKCLLLLSLIYIKRLFRLVLNYAKFRILLLFILSGGKTYLHLFQCLTNQNNMKTTKTTNDRLFSTSQIVQFLILAASFIYFFGHLLIHLNA